MIPSTSQKMIDGLWSQYNNLSKTEQGLLKQISYTSNLADKNALKNQLSSCYEEMNEIEDQLWEIAATKQIKYLYEIVVMINTSIIAEAYQVSLMGRIDAVRKTTLKEKLLILQEIPDNPLPKFVNKIIADRRLLNEDRKQMLQQWLIDQGWPVESPIAMENYLMIKVEEDKSLDYKYIVTAMLVQAENHFRPEYNDYLPILSPIEIFHRTKENLCDAFCELISLCCEKGGVDILELNVHWFLPIALMNLSIEDWSVKIDKLRPSGKWCKTVVVRIYERHFSSPYDNKLERWQKYWRCLEYHQEFCCSETLDLIEVDELVDRRKDTICGCRLLQLGKQSRDFWENVIEQGLPIVLWLKSSETDAQATEKAMHLVTRGEIGKLPTDLAHYRSQGTSRSENFSLLWDNPFQSYPGVRLSSTSVYKSQNTKVN